MSNEKMREEFEAWAVKYNLARADWGNYQDRHVNNMWKAWQASRAALCVELPEFPDMETIADIDYAHEMPKNGWDEDSFSIWQKLQVAQRNKMQLFSYAKKLKSIIISIKSGN